MITKAKLTVSKKVLGIFTVLFSLQSALASAQNETAKITRYEVKEQYQEDFQKAISEYVQKSILKESNIMSEAYFEQNNKTVIWLFERWTSKAALDKNNSKSLKELVKTALVKPEKIIYVKDLEPLTKEQWRRTSKKEDNQLTIMLFVDAKAGTEKNFMEVYHTAMPQFRSEPGVVTYQLSQLENDKTQFVTFEKFRSNDAFQYHLNFPPIQPVIDYLNTSIKKQPFQDGIHNLIEFAPLIRE
ncbi:Quinol monooxygenase YgiN [Flavobacterium sp. CF108]|uniref:putative quinol monooxygenase n=1 Tax=unclassified Flavobacterium TaxID=196869 RepID=UPI0008BEEFC5|nr:MULTISPECIES: antibiotic biosynthesis monooxygenase [unclassified Flavobacterium]SEO70844.1 Quinol monooxygenase YgiN [Flavobacterium sp. fv08]SHH91182.1 Quinol monooxygenase YgiN [Flavobacterium sp. CF108]